MPIYWEPAKSARLCPPGTGIQERQEMHAFKASYERHQSRLLALKEARQPACTPTAPTSRNQVAKMQVRLQKAKDVLLSPTPIPALAGLGIGTPKSYNFLPQIGTRLSNTCVSNKPAQQPICRLYPAVFKETPF